MESKTKNKIKLGAFVTVGIAFFIIGIYYIGQKQRLFAHTFRIRSIYRDVNGLQVGNNVRFAGINVGNVEKISILSDTSVEVDLLLDKSVEQFIKKDAQASVGSEGLMGDKLVVIAPGSEGGTEIANNDYIQTGDGNGMDAIMGQIKIVAQNAAHITGDLSDIVGNIHQGKGTIGKLFMDTAIAQNLNQALVNVKHGAAGFSDNMDAVKHNVLLRGYFKKKEKQQEKDSLNKAASAK